MRTPAKGSLMNSNKQPAGLKLTSTCGGDRLSDEITTGVQQGQKNYCLIDPEINYIMGITKPIDSVPYLFS